MTLENLKKNHARLKWLKSGEFTERDFDYTINANDNPNGEKGESGRMTMGDFVNKTGQKRKELIVFKATKNLEDFEKKYDENYLPKKKEQVKVVPKEEVKVEPEPVSVPEKVVQKTKSKGKK